MTHAAGHPGPCDPARHGAPRAIGPSRRGFTLAEVLVSVFVLSIVMSGLMSALLLATKTLPQQDDPAMIAPDADAALEMIMADAMLAGDVQAASNGLRLTVPDRDEDSNPETVEYTLADPDNPPTELMMRINGGPDRVLLNRVRGMTMKTTTVNGDRSILTIELATGRGVVHHASIELLRRPGG